MKRKLPYTVRVKNHRWENQMTQKQLADEVGISTRALMDIENAKSVPSLVVAMNLAHHLSSSVEELFVFKW